MLLGSRHLPWPLPGRCIRGAALSPSLHRHGASLFCSLSIRPDAGRGAVGRAGGARSMARAAWWRSEASRVQVSKAAATGDLKGNPCKWLPYFRANVAFVARNKRTEPSKG
ncbi:hypothetical protein GQ53DRAFT_402079 [Thozetella sp. PMI_491]|nr:hypothetical protein GQ53DRAFT_402079 [Thozetella sp. PMI_491]